MGISRPPKVIKIGRIYRERYRSESEVLPFIRLSGKWMRTAGFEQGAHVDVVVEHGQIRIVSTPPAVTPHIQKQS